MSASWVDIHTYHADYYCMMHGVRQSFGYVMVEAKCSACGRYSDFEGLRFSKTANYCPNCGEKMEECVNGTKNRYSL